MDDSETESSEECSWESTSHWTIRETNEEKQQNDASIRHALKKIKKLQVCGSKPRQIAIILPAGYICPAEFKAKLNEINSLDHPTVATDTGSSNQNTSQEGTHGRQTGLRSSGPDPHTSTTIPLEISLEMDRDRRFSPQNPSNQ